jgi:transcriptional regulator with PAS, ATPase and Fis domain
MKLASKFLRPSLFDKVRNDNKLLIETTLSVLQQSLAHFRTKRPFNIGLFDYKGILLFRRDVNNFNELQPGLDFSEHAVGTSAQSLCSQFNRPICLVGPENYNISLVRCTVVSSAPIHDSEGKLIGVLDISHYSTIDQEQDLLAWIIAWQLSTINRIEEKLKLVTRKILINKEYRDEKADHRCFEAIYSFGDIMGNSKEILKAKRIAQKIACDTGSVLLLGESGTGKELFAHAIHLASRPYSPFVVINCAAIPANLIASELFGYAGGSFTGADKKGKAGKIELADNGTLFLDEIGEMPLDLQAVLLRVLQDKQVMRVGSAKYIPVDFRLIAATNKSLAQLTETKVLREDLYFRLATFRLSIPALKNRGDDIIALAQHFVQQKCRLLKKPALLVDSAVYKCLLHYDWPGNVRQLQNAMHFAVGMAEGHVIQLHDLPEEIIEYVSRNKLPELSKVLAKPKSLSQSERELIKKTMEETSHNIAETAKILGVSRTTIYRKSKKYDIL